MDPIQALIALAAALPDLIKLGQDAITYLNKVSGNDPQGYVKRVGGALAKLNAAVSDEERQDAAQAFADAISNLP